MRISCLPLPFRKLLSLCACSMPLINAFVESVVCVGFSSERGLTLDPESKNNTSVFSSFLQPALLSIVTGDNALYPLSAGSEFVDPSYPPINRADLNSYVASGGGSGRSTPSLMTTASVKGQKPHAISSALRNLPMFCFPEGVKPTYRREPDKIHHIVLTQEEGKRSYALVLTYQQGFVLRTNKPDDDGVYQIDDCKLASVNARRPSVSKIPIAIDRQKSNPGPAAATGVKMRSRKMPTSFQYTETTTAPKPRSTTPSDFSKASHRYAAPTISSNLKKCVLIFISSWIRCSFGSSMSSSAEVPLPRMVRTNSQTSLTPTNGTSSTSSGMRKRSNSNTSSTVATSTAPSTTAVHDTTKPFYLPHCIVLISSQPYWTAMQETISIMYDEMVGQKTEAYTHDYKQLIQKYAFLACNTPVPPIPWERYSLSFNLSYDQSVLTFDPPLNIGRPVLDLDLSMLLLTLNIGKLLDVLAAILTQQPIIFFSANYSSLVTTLECLLFLIYPLKWVHVYVPLVPDGLRDYYMEGPPGSYIMGAHARHEEIVEQLGMSFTCNLDNSKNMTVPAGMEFPRIPPSKLQRFTGPITRLLEEIKTARSSQNLHSPVRLRIDQQREDERQHRFETNNRIIEIFYDLIVDLCGDALEPIYWKVNHQKQSPSNTLTRTPPTEVRNSLSVAMTSTTFSKDRYLLSKMDGVEKEFYQAFVSSTAFQLLMEEEKLTTASSTPFQQICQLRSLSHDKQSYHFNNTVSDDEDHDHVNASLNR